MRVGGGMMNERRRDNREGEEGEEGEREGAEEGSGERESKGSVTDRVASVRSRLHDDAGQRKYLLLSPHNKSCV